MAREFERRKKKRKTRAANENAGGIQISIELRIRTGKMTRTSIDGRDRESTGGRRPVQGMLTVPAAAAREKVRERGSKSATANKKTDVMQCGHDRCRLWWASQGRFLWNSKHSDSPVDCVFSHLASASDFGPASHPPSFVPHQPAKVHLKTICPDKKKTHKRTCLDRDGGCVKTGDR